MLPVLTMSLIVLVVLLLGIGAFLLIQAAFSGERDIGRKGEATLTWRPPFIQGEALRNWAMATAEHLAASRLGRKPSAKDALQLVEELEEGATHAMLPLAREADCEHVLTCPECGQGMVGVTAPEALRIADYIRKNFGHGRQKRIHDLAAANARRIGSMQPEELQQSPLSCPLAGDDYVCRTFPVRPLHCRPLHARSIAQTNEQRVEMSAYGQLPAGLQPEEAVEDGVRCGLTRALESAGLDGRVYELNSALAVALETPHAADRWARGENVFGNCQLSISRARRPNVLASAAAARG